MLCMALQPHLYGDPAPSHPKNIWLALRSAVIKTNKIRIPIPKTFLDQKFMKNYENIQTKKDNTN